MLAPDAQTSAAPADDLLWRHLKSLPAFRALLRAVEARFYRQLDIPEPVLDLGCGDGHFAAMAFDRPLASGVDPWWGPLTKARRAGVYRLCVQALGHALPYADEAFACVISNSVLEHIPDIQPVLDEASRVLQPGGKLIITMPSHLFTENLGGAALLRPLGLSDTYRRFFNRISRHAHTDPPQVWAQRLAHAGFAVERWQYYFSKGALRALELGHVQGLPSAVLHFLTGQWILAPWRENLRLAERWLRPYYVEPPPGAGAYILMVARKTASPAPTDGPIEVRLPAPRPLPVVEPDAQSQTPEASKTPAAVPEIGAPEQEEASVFIFRPEDARATSAPRAPAAPHSNRGLLATLLLFAGLLAAWTAQGILAQRLPTLWTGISWYAVAIIAFAAAATILHPRAGAHLTVAFSRRLLLLPLAAVLAMMAQEQAGSSLTGGSPLLAFALWLAGIALAYFALSQPVKAEDQDGEPDEPVEPVAAPSTLPRLYALPLLLGALFLFALVPRLLWLTAHPFIVNGIEASIGLDAVAVLQGHIRNPFATSWLSNPSLPLYPAALPPAAFGRSVLTLRLLPALVGAVTVPVLFIIARRLWNFWFALVAALLLSGYHLHVHYSRLGMTNVWDPLLALLVFGAIASAAVRPSRQSWLLAGLALGASTYFYTASHLTPFFLVVFALYLLFLRRDVLAHQAAHLLAAAGLALVVALPQIIYYQANPGLFMERANVLGILQSDWLVQQTMAGRSTAAVFGDQLRRSFLAFHGSLDASTSYNPGIPLLRTWPAIFFTLGLAVSIWSLRQARYALLVIWLFVTYLFGGALLVEAPSSHRLLIVAPFVAILVTAGLFWLARLFRKALAAQFTPDALSQLRNVIPLHTLVAILLVIFFIAGDLLFYFGPYRNSYRFADRNSEIAHEVGLYLDSLEGDWQAYFHGPPAMYVSFPTILFFADSFRPGVNLLDVPDATVAVPEGPPGANLVFIYLPERSGEVNQTSQRYPEGRFLTFDGVLQNPLFYSYEVRP